MDAIIWQKAGDDRRYAQHAIALNGIEGTIDETMCGLLKVIRRKALQTEKPVKKCKRCEVVIRTRNRRGMEYNY